MIYAHVFMTLRDADLCFRDYLSVWRNIISKIENYKIVMINGDEHHFMSVHNYRKWSKGRTYTLDGRLYHSGELYVERGDNHEID